MLTYGKTISTYDAAFIQKQKGRVTSRKIKVATSRLNFTLAQLLG